MITSLPTRERELKLGLRDELGEHILSLPTRERELKLRGPRRGPRQWCRSLHGSVN